MDAKYMKKVEEKYYKNNVPDMKPGDTVKAHIKIVEGDKERIQIFEGVIIAINGTGISKTITVRKISHGVGVEKIFPIHSPILEKIELVSRGQVRRSKLYYLRNKIGKRSLDVGFDENFVAEDDESSVASVQDESTDNAASEVEEKETKDEVSESGEVATESKKAESSDSKDEVEDVKPEESKEN
ncbi:50S ribosomal protein L19 [Candidatus Dojkabacteria bacterium]|nr:50S ribosomal protein L19 [Candidatus Dojkabacteria bacterium]